MDARDRLIDSASELLWERGYVGTSPRAIQRVAGVGQGSMYHHFASKSELAAEAMLKSAKQMRAEVEARLSGSGPALERVARYLLSERDVLRGCRIGRLTYDPAVLADPALRAPIGELFCWQQQTLAQVLREGKERGEIGDALDVDDLAATIAATLQGAYVLARAAGNVAAFQRAINGLLSLLASCVVTVDDAAPVAPAPGPALDV